MNKEQNNKPVKIMIFGAFDLLHLGHKHFIKSAKKEGDFLIAVVGRDLTIKHFKGEFPVERENLRLKNIQKLVDKAILGNSKDFLKPIKDNKPDLICLGYDQKFLTDSLSLKLKELGLDVKIKRLEPYKPEKYKSSILKKYLLKNK